ncbi:MAG: protein kinase [Deltaproteobacteria bacterium]|nr:protein kinase [Deltaproteobacteria bacterium]
MAEVFEATAHGAEGFARPVAIKRMLPTLSLDPAFGQMFVNEARIASLLHHEHVVSVLDFDRDAEGRYFLVMELVRGIDLRRLAASGPLPWSVIALILGEVLDGLGYAHELERNGRPLGIVHRDVSPHNVMISWDGSAKVVDFGIAKAVAATGASRSNSLKGKMAYMSPEQAHGVDLDGRSDVFAVGVMAYELATGQKLFGGQTEAEVLARLLTQPIAWPRTLRQDIPPDLEAVIMRMVERDRDRRFPSAQAAHEALLATSAIDPRAQIDLRELLRRRFPEAPRRRGESQPAFVATPHGPMPHLADTIPATPGASAMMAADTRTRAQAQSAVRNGASRRPLWIALAVIGAIAAVIVSAAVARRGGKPQIAIVTIDAGVASDAAAAAPPGAAIDAGAVNAAVVPTVTSLPDAGIAVDAGARDRGRHGDARSAPPDVAPVTPAPPDAAPAVALPPDAAPAPVAPGTLTVRVKPWAHVFLDGKPQRDTPLDLKLPPGRYTVRVTNDALAKDETDEIEIVSGQTASVSKRWDE